MSLPDHVKRFWYALEGLAQSCERTRFGCIVRDDRYPRVRDANKVMVLESCPDLTLDELGAIGHVEFLDLDDRCPALQELGAPQGVDVVMVAPAARPDPGRAREITVLDDDFWTQYTAVAASL